MMRERRQLVPSVPGDGFSYAGLPPVTRLPALRPVRALQFHSPWPHPFAPQAPQRPKPPCSPASSLPGASPTSPPRSSTTAPGLPRRSPGHGWRATAGLLTPRSTLRLQPRGCTRMTWSWCELTTLAPWRTFTLSISRRTRTMPE